ncbi:hypothetical protein CDIK_3039 [Cucumispora dikerogammari]|nr:hypothetical protein CDIK_3039 [Cucumispora dikerogammari]
MILSLLNFNQTKTDFEKIINKSFANIVSKELKHNVKLNYNELNTILSDFQSLVQTNEKKIIPVYLELEILINTLELNIKKSLKKHKLKIKTFNIFKLQMRFLLFLIERYYIYLKMAYYDINIPFKIKQKKIDKNNSELFKQTVLYPLTVFGNTINHFFEPVFKEIVMLNLEYELNVGKNFLDFSNLFLTSISINYCESFFKEIKEIHDS